MPAPLAFDDPVATTLVFGPLLGSVVLENRRFRGDGRLRLSDRTYWLLQAWQIAGLALGVLFARRIPGAALPGTEWLWPVLGCAVGLIGVALRWWAISTLGEHFTRNLQVGANHRLVVGGPYLRLRHPSYKGAILVFTGIGLGLGNSLSLLVCALLPTVGYVLRIPREEALLRGSLGAPYAEYARHTHRLVPGIW